MERGVLQNIHRVESSPLCKKGWVKFFFLISGPLWKYASKSKSISTCFECKQFKKKKSFNTFKKQICFRYIQLITKRHTCVLHPCAGLKLHPNLELWEVFKFKGVSLTDQGSHLEQQICHYCMKYLVIGFVVIWRMCTSSSNSQRGDVVTTWGWKHTGPISIFTQIMISAKPWINATKNNLQMTTCVSANKWCNCSLFSWPPVIDQFTTQY